MLDSILSGYQKVQQWLSAALFPPRSLGQRGEDAATRLLRRKGYKIIHRGYHDQHGEIDIIAVHKRVVVFVEVKTRKRDYGDSPATAVTLEKQKRITRTALAFQKRNRLLQAKSRYDIVAIVWPDGQRKPTIKHYVDAFESYGTGQMHS